MQKSARHSCRINCPDCQTHLRQATGSNMQAEDGLASVFGRYAIETSVNTAYRTVVDRFGSQHARSDIIHLRSGRGSTLERALAVNSSFVFRTALQCAFLCSVCLHSLRVVQTLWLFQWTLLSFPYPLTTHREHCVLVNLDTFKRS